MFIYTKNKVNNIIKVFTMKRIKRMFLPAALLISAVVSSTDISAQKVFNLDESIKSEAGSQKTGIFAMPGERQAAHSPAAPISANENERTRVIVDENFSAWTKGSEAEPDTVNMVSSLNPYLDDSLMQQPGWSGFCLFQAGGVAAMTDFGGGAINTPLGDYSGDLKISFRVKPISTSASIIVSVCKGDIWFPETAGEYTECSKTFNVSAEDGWQELTFEYRNIYSDNDGFIQINVPYRQILIDDIKVTSEITDFIAAPEVKTATAFKADGFTANWGNVYFAEHYELSVYKETPEETDDMELNETFDNAQSDGTNITGISPDISISGFDISEADGTNGTKCLTVENDNAEILLPENGGRVKECSVWLKIVKGAPYSSTILFEAWNGNRWYALTAMQLGMLMYEENMTGIIEFALEDVLSPVYSLRIRFDGFEEEAETVRIGIDNLYYKTAPASKHEMIVDAMQIEENNYELSGLDPEGEYYYYVTSVNGDLRATSDPIYAFGLTAPVAKEATDIDLRGGYTANWDKTPKASYYQVKNYSVYIAEENIDNYTVLYEDFEQIESDSELDNPEIIDNASAIVPLDDYIGTIGWTGGGNAFTDGMFGFTFANGYASLSTPAMTLDNNEGNFTMTVTAYGYVGDMIIVEGSSATPEYNAMAFYSDEGNTMDYITFTTNFTGGSANEVLKFSSNKGYPILIDDIRIEQNLKAGDRVYTLYSINNVNNGDEVSTRFSGLVTDNKYYAYDVTAYIERMGNVCASETSNRIEVPFYKSVDMETADETMIVYAEGKVYATLPEAETVRIYDMLGRLLMSEDCKAGENVLNFSGKGIYMVVAGDTARKIIVE